MYLFSTQKQKNILNVNEIIPVHSITTGALAVFLGVLLFNYFDLHSSKASSSDVVFLGDVPLVAFEFPKRLVYDMATRSRHPRKTL